MLKEPTVRIPTKVFQNLTIPANVKVTCSPNGWMTGALMQDWISRCWGSDTDDVRCLLILDKARIHTIRQTQDNCEQVNTDIIFIPAGCTSLAQPADVSWNKPFKGEMRQQWKTWRQQDLRTPAGNLKVKNVDASNF